jgi:hypothetical protein
VKIWLPKSKWYPKSKVNIDEYNLSDKGENFRFVERHHVFSRSWAGIYRENVPTIHSILLNSMHPEHAWFFLNRDVLGTIHPWILRVYYVACSGTVALGSSFWHRYLLHKILKLHH